MIESAQGVFDPTFSQYSRGVACGYYMQSLQAREYRKAVEHLHFYQAPDEERKGGRWYPTINQGERLHNVSYEY